jgi:hypothetical protein
MGRLFDLISELAERGVGTKGIGQGSPDAQAASLIMLAIDNLTTAAQADEEGAPTIWKAIDLLKQRYSTQKPSEDSSQDQQPNFGKKPETDSKNESNSVKDKEKEEEEK